MTTAPPDRDLDAAIDRLYGVPLDEFVARRDELAKSLRRSGDREAADRVKALRKPTAGAWALNQAVRRRRAQTQELLEASERLREAHRALLSGGDRDELRSAMDDQRGLAGVLADCAEAIASETGKSGPALKERVRSTLHAAALDDEIRDELAAGRLAREREAVGLGAAFGGEAGAPAPPRPAARPKKPGPAPRTRDRPAERSAAERERRRAAELADAERLLGEAEAALERSETEHDEASERVDAARAVLAEAERAEREARKALRERRREHARRERELRRLQG